MLQLPRLVGIEKKNSTKSRAKKNQANRKIPASISEDGHFIGRTRDLDQVTVYNHTPVADVDTAK